MFKLVVNLELPDAFPWTFSSSWTDVVWGGVFKGDGRETGNEMGGED